LAFFFGGEKGLVQTKRETEEDDFTDIFNFMWELGQATRLSIKNLLARPEAHAFRTSAPKVIDNAIVGYGRERLRIPIGDDDD
jgi:hypothetical protein